MRKVLLDVFYSVQTRGFWVAVFLSAAAFMEAVLAEGEGDLLYLYTMSMSFGIFTVAASCIAVLPTVRELSSYKGSIMKYNLLRSGTSRYIVGKAISISIIGGLALMLGPAISLIVLSFKNPLVSEAFLDIYWAKVAGRFNQGSFEQRFDAYVKSNCLLGLTWSANAWVEYHDPARPLKNAKTFEKLKQYLSQEFLDQCFDICF